jgi:2-polyprenyl-6-hydroxyphenyl methylase/3-demethylubiquinone-9 3-methyltransferase
MAHPAEKSNPTSGPWKGSTADADEIARFTAMAETWWDTTGKFRPLHQINPPRLGFIRDHVCALFGRDPKADEPLKGLSILDIGCGGGLICEPMCRLGATVTGIDAGEKNVKIAALHAAQTGLDIDYRCTLPEELAETGRSFDVVLNLEIIEHVANVDAFLSASTALVRPGGAMVLSTINRTMKALALAKIGAEYILRWLPAGTHDWRKFLKPSEMAAALRPHGIKITDLAGLVYSPLRDEWSIDRNDLAMNYLAFAVKD